jgi:hypothetical protein
MNAARRQIGSFSIPEDRLPAALLAREAVDRAKASASPASWVIRTARVERICRGWNLADSCGSAIKVGDTFAQSKHRAGLAHAELCMACAGKAGAA